MQHINATAWATIVFQRYSENDSGTEIGFEDTINGSPPKQNGLPLLKSARQSATILIRRAALFPRLQGIIMDTAPLALETDPGS